MRVAVVHDWLVTNAGAEKVLKAICELYPNADIFSLVDFLDSSDRDEVISGKYAKTSFIQKLPFAKTHFRNYLPLFPKAIESFDLSDYELIISSSWAVAKGIKRDNNQTHICYCHTPIRYAWDLYSEYTHNLKQPKKFLVQQSLKYIRKWDIETVDRVDYFIANSNFVKERIERIYKRDSTVIYPPVDTKQFRLNIPQNFSGLKPSVPDEKEDFYLTASRLVPYKKTKLIVEAFNKMPNKRLVVIGDGEEYNEIKKIAKSNIEILGYQSDKVLKEKMQRAKGFVYGAVEDFGIVPIEAMACGTPVIALDEGGTAETVIDGVNGVHFKKQQKEDIIEAIERFETLSFDSMRISKYANSYATDRFKEEIRELVLFRTNLH